MTLPLKEQAARGFVWTSAGQWGFHLLNALTFIAFTRPLQPEDFGIWALITLFYELAQAIGLSGFATALVQKPKLSSIDLNSTFWGQAALAVVLLIGAQLVAQPLAQFFNIPKLETIWRVTSCILILDSLNIVPLALIRRNFKFHLFALQKTSAVAAGAVAGIYAAFNGYGVWSFVIFHGVMALVRFVIIWSCIDWLPQFQFSPSHFRQIFLFSFNLTSHNLLTFIRKRFDDLLIGIVFGPVILGFYNIAYRLLFIVMDVFNNPLNNVSMSLIARLQDDPLKALRAHTKIFHLTTLFALPVFTAISLLAPQMVSLLFGEKWQASAPLLRILALSGIGLSFIHLNITTLTSLGKTRRLVQLSVLFTLSSCVIYSIAVTGGVAWIAAACLFISLAIWPVSYRMLLHSMGETSASHPSANTMKICIATFSMAGTLWLTQALTSHTTLWFQFPTCVISGVLSYTLTLFIIDRTFIKDIQEVTLLILRKTGRPRAQG